jgi:hypothetical protein
MFQVMGFGPIGMLEFWNIGLRLRFQPVMVYRLEGRAYTSQRILAAGIIVEIQNH